MYILFSKLDFFLLNKKIKNAKNPKILLLNDKLEKKLKKSGLKYKKITSYNLDLDKIEDETIKIFRKISDYPLIDDENFKQLFNHEDLSLWWFIDEKLYSGKFTVDMNLHDKIKTHIIMTKIIGLEKPNFIEFGNLDIGLQLILKEICSSKKIALNQKIISLNFYKKITFKIKIVLTNFNHIFVLFMRKLIWEIVSLGVSKTKIDFSPKNQMLIFTGDNWRKICDWNNGENRYGDIYFDSIIDLLKERNFKVTFIDTPTAATNWNIFLMKKKINSKRFFYRPYESFIDLKMLIQLINKSYKLNKKFKKISKEIFNNDESKKIHKYIELSKDNLRYVFSLGSIFHSLLIIDLSKKILRIISPKTVLIAGEFLAERSLVAFSNFLKIKVYFFQHGLYSPFYIHFNHIKKDINLQKESVLNSCCPMANKFVFYSNYDKKNLIQRAKIPSDDVLIVGQPRYDIIARSGNIFNLKKIIKEYGLDLANRKVLWLSDGHAISKNVSINYAESISAVCNKLSEINLIVKPHPAEKDYSPYYKYKSDSTLITNNASNTLKLLFAADVVIVNLSSTTIIEAMFFNKPVILLSSSKNNSIYIEEGLFVKVKNKEELLYQLNRILNDVGYRNKVIEYQNNFLSKYGFRCDGHATKTLVDLIAR